MNKDQQNLFFSVFIQSLKLTLDGNMIHWSIYAHVKVFHTLPKTDRGTPRMVLVILCHNWKAMSSYVKKKTKNVYFVEYEYGKQ